MLHLDSKRCCVIIAQAQVLVYLCKSIPDDPPYNVVDVHVVVHGLLIMCAAIFSPTMNEHGILIIQPNSMFWR